MPADGSLRTGPVGMCQSEQHSCPARGPGCSLGGHSRGVAGVRRIPCRARDRRSAVNRLARSRRGPRRHLELLGPCLGRARPTWVISVDEVRRRRMPAALPASCPVGLVNRPSGRTCWLMRQPWAESGCQVTGRPLAINQGPPRSSARDEAPEAGRHLPARPIRARSVVLHLFGRWRSEVMTGAVALPHTDRTP